MAFRKQVLGEINNSYDNFSEHYKDIRAFFEIVNVRFAIAEYGVSLKCVAGNKLFTNASGYLLSDDSSYPFYLWLPSWLGRFYIDPARIPQGVEIDHCRIEDTRFIAFIWTWLGYNDAYVNDAGQPECWFGVAEPAPDDPSLHVADVADMIWKYFRVERTTEGASEDWLQGHFLRNTIGCTLNGQWHMRRVPLTELTSFYQIEKLLVRPLGEKFASLSAAGLATPKAHLVGANTGTPTAESRMRGLAIDTSPASLAAPAASTNGPTAPRSRTSRGSARPA
jgi:hypothetical protein